MSLRRVNMSIIIPSILEEDLDSFRDKASQIEKIPGVTNIQVDFSDGIFTPHKTVAASDLDILNPAFSWEAHLMVAEPKANFFDCKLAGFNKIIFHYESVRDKSELKLIRSQIQDLKMTAVMAIRPETQIEEVLPHANGFEEVLLLSVRPGYQGGEFIEGTYERLEKLRKGLKNVKLEVDGAVKADNALKLLDFGADFLVIGSALFGKNESGEADPAKNFEKIQMELQARETQ